MGMQKVFIMKLLPYQYQVLGHK